MYVLRSTDLATHNDHPTSGSCTLEAASLYYCTSKSTIAGRQTPMQNSPHIEEEGQRSRRRRRRQCQRGGDGTSTHVRNHSSTCHLMRYCCCSVLLLPMGSAFHLHRLPHGSSQLSQLYLPPRHERMCKQDAQHVSVSSVGIIMGARVAEPSSSARSSRVGMTDRIHATALRMSSQFDHDDDEGDDVKKKRKPTKLSRIKTSRSIQNVYWTLCPAARYDRDNNGNGNNRNGNKNAKNRTKRNDTNERSSTDLSRTTHPLLAAAALQVGFASLRAVDLRSRRGLPVRLEPRVRGGGRHHAAGEGGAHAVVPQPVVSGSDFSP